jgi:hypothetical protein
MEFWLGHFAGAIMLENVNLSNTPESGQLTESTVVALVLAGLRHLQADSAAGRDLSYLEQLADESLPADKDGLIDRLCEAINFEGLEGLKAADTAYWPLFERAMAWQAHDKSASPGQSPDLLRLDPSEVMQLHRLHRELFGEGGRSQSDPRHRPKCRIGDTVSIRGLGFTGKVIMEDPDAANHPHVPGEAVWYLELANGAEGGGWRDSELTPEGK